MALLKLGIPANMEEGPLELTGPVVATALQPVLADPSGRRARILGVVSTAVVALLLVWLLGLVVAALGILPLSGLPLERLLAGDPVARAPVPVRSQPHVAASGNMNRMNSAAAAPSWLALASGRSAQTVAGVREFRLAPPAGIGLTPTTRKAAHRGARHRARVARHPVAVAAVPAAPGTVAPGPGTAAARLSRGGAHHGRPSGVGRTPPRDVSSKAQSAPGRSDIWANPGAGRGHGGSEKAHSKGR